MLMRDGVFYYGLADVVQDIGKTYNWLHYRVTMGMVPSPAHKFGCKLYYTQEDLEAIRKYVKQSDKIAKGAK